MEKIIYNLLVGQKYLSIRFLLLYLVSTEAVEKTLHEIKLKENNVYFE